jgi:hypothetical protein
MKKLYQNARGTMRRLKELTKQAWRWFTFHPCTCGRSGNDEDVDEQQEQKEKKSGGYAY